MGTRIQDKSRPTKKPIEVVDQLGAHLKGKRPHDDPKGYPLTNGTPIPVLVRGQPVLPVGPAGTVLIGYWNIVPAASGTAGSLALIYPLVTLSTVDSAATDQAAVLLALGLGDTLFVGTDTGTNEMVITSVADNSPQIEFTMSSQDFAGLLNDGQLAAVYGTAP